MREGGFPELRELSDEELASGPEGATVRRWRHEAELLLARRADPDRPRTVHMPSHVSASALVAMDSDPEGFVSGLRRPMPRKPGSAARAGTAFHTWVENFYGDCLLYTSDAADEAYDVWV